MTQKVDRRCTKTRQHNIQFKDILHKPVSLARNIRLC